MPRKVSAEVSCRWLCSGCVLTWSVSVHICVLISHEDIGNNDEGYSHDLTVTQSVFSETVSRGWGVAQWQKNICLTCVRPWV